MSPDELQPANLKDVRDAARTQVPEDLPVGAPPPDAPKTPAKGKKPRGGPGIVSVVIVLAIVCVAAYGAYLIYEKYFPTETPPEPTVDVKTVEPGIGLPATRDIVAEAKVKRTKPFHGTPEAEPLPVETKPAGLFDDVKMRAAAQAGGEPIDYKLLISDPEPPMKETRPVDDDLAPIGPSETPLPDDRGMERAALSPNEMPKSGMAPRDYLVLLRNALNKPDDQKIDLQKVYILVSMYYNPQIDPEMYRGYLDNLTKELYHRLTMEGVDTQSGRTFRKPIVNPREQVRIITEFMRRGWQVQEFHAGVTGAGTPLEDHMYLVHEVLANGDKARNDASNTALNLLTLVLLRKIAAVGTGFDKFQTGNALDQPVQVPLYGVRLPDRTVLRYDATGAGQPLPDEESNTFEQGASLDDAVAHFSRNIEYLRNGNHYSGADYIKRCGISESDRRSRIYLWTLNDREFFATLGYELARVEVMRGTQQGYRRAQEMLEEWVLDRDDGRGMRANGMSRSRPVFPAPRGDSEKLRDAYLLYADMMLRQSKYDKVRVMLEDCAALHSDAERMAEMQGYVRQSQGMWEQAIQQFEAALDVNEENPRAHLYLGHISFMLSDASTPPSLVGTDVDRLAMALRHLDDAERFDMGTLSGDERFLLHYHRALANQRKNNLLAALKDMEHVARIQPTFARTVAYDATMQRLRMDRAFEVLETSAAKTEGKLKFEAVAYLDENLSMVPECRADLLRAAKAFGKTGNLAAECELARALSRITGQSLERDGAAWERWLREHFKQNP